MNAKTLGDILAVTSASITLLLTVIGILNNLFEKTTAPLDTPSLKILRIERIRSKGGCWERFFSGLADAIVFYYYFWFTIILNMVSFMILVALVVIEFTNFLDLSGSPFIASGIIIDTISISLLVYSLFYIRLRLFEGDFKDYFLFEEVDIIIDADFQYLFHKCIEVLKGLNLKIIKVEQGNSTGTVKAIQVFLNIFARTRTITVTVQKIKYSESAYTVDIEYSQKYESSDKDSHKNIISIYYLLISKSKFTNIFIDRLISKSPK